MLIDRVRRLFRIYPATSVLLMLVSGLLIYRLWVYRLPMGKPQRNPADYVLDVAGYSWHFFLLAFENPHWTGKGVHAEAGLLYKPQDSYLRQFVKGKTGR